MGLGLGFGLGLGLGCAPFCATTKAYCTSMAERLTWLGLGVGVRVRLGLGLGLGFRASPTLTLASPKVHGREAHVEVHGARADDRGGRAHRGVHDEAPLRGECCPPRAGEHRLAEECARP